jgi:flagellar hook-associated protein 3 FlgL
MQFNLSGSPANGDSFTVSPSTQQSVFTTLSNLVQALRTPASTPAVQTQIFNSLSAGLQNIDQATNQVLSTRATIGARVNEIQALTSGNQSQNTQYQQNLSTLQDVNYTQAISQLSQQELALQAAQQSFVKISGLTLFSYLNG